MIQVTASWSIGADELVESFVRASGPGGQHVNTTATAVELRFDAAGSPTLPPGILERLGALAGSRMTRDGVIVLRAEAHRSQSVNRADALQRLLDLLREAAKRRPVRRPTRPTLASKKRRLDGKERRGAVKALRGRRPPADD